MIDDRVYIIKPFDYWATPRAKHVFNVRDDELSVAVAHPQGIIREESDRVLVLAQDAKEYILKEAEKGNVSEVLKRHNAKNTTK